MERFRPGLVAQLELPAGDEARHVAARADQRYRRLGRLHPPLCAILGLRGLAGERRPVEYAAVAHAAMLEDRILVDLEVLAGHVVVVIAQADLARGKGLGLAEFGQLVRRRADAEMDGGAGNGREAVIVVGHHERMAVGIMLEEVEPSLFFHQPGHEMQRCLVVLCRGLAGRRLGIKPKRDFGHARVVEDRLEDILGGLVEEQAAIAADIGLGKLRHQDDAIERVDHAACFDGAELGDDAVEIPRRLLAMIDGEAGRLVEHVSRVDRAGRNRLDLKSEQLADRLVRHQPYRVQLMLGGAGEIQQRFLVTGHEVPCSVWCDAPEAKSRSVLPRATTVTQLAGRFHVP